MSHFKSRARVLVIFMSQNLDYVVQNSLVNKEVGNITTITINLSFTEISLN